VLQYPPQGRLHLSFDAAFLSRVATRIINEVQGIHHMVYDYT